MIQKLSVLLLVLVLVLGISWGQWGKEATLVSSQYELAIQKLYTHAAAPHLTHLIYTVRIQYYNMEAMHLVVDAHNQIVVPPQKIGVHSSTTAIDGADDNKRAYIVYQQENEDSDGSALYFIETANAGKTWSQPIPLGNNADIWYRGYPNLMYDRGTGRVWVFYTSQDTQRKMRLTAISRPKGSSVFTREVFIYNTTDELNQLKLAYTREGKSGTRIHLQWSNTTAASHANILYSYSKDNGITWSEPYVVLPDVTPMLFDMGGSRSSKVPALATSGFSSPAFLRISEDAGNTWKEMIEFRGYGERSVVICGNETLNGTYVFLATASGTPVQFYYTQTHNARQVTRGPDPFEPRGHSRVTVGLTCYMQDSHTIIVNAVSIRLDTPQHNVIINSYKHLLP